MNAMLVGYLCCVSSPYTSFEHFSERLHTAMESPLPGEDAQFEMSPMGRPRRQSALADISNPKLSAVLVLFYPFGDEPHTVLMLRNAYPGVHSAQVSFPGGKHEDIDNSLQETALREANEEVGVQPNNITVAGQLTQVYIPPSGFLVEPYVGIASQRPSFVPNPDEVQQIIEVPVRELLNEANRTTREIPLSNGVRINAPCYLLQNHVVWGATAMMLSEARAILARM